LTVALPDAAARGRAEILLANILAEPLMELAPSFAERVAPGGSIVLSGILRGQAPPVASRYAAWFDMRPAVIREDWALLHGVRRF
jgi:ribosomal protein L11 methyltransferase